MRALRPAQALQEEHAAGARIAQPSRLGGKKKNTPVCGRLLPTSPATLGGRLQCEHSGVTRTHLHMALCARRRAPRTRTRCTDTHTHNRK